MSGNTAASPSSVKLLAFAPGCLTDFAHRSGEEREITFKAAAVGGIQGPVDGAPRVPQRQILRGCELREHPHQDI